MRPGRLPLRINVPWFQVDRQSVPRATGLTSGCPVIHGAAAIESCFAIRPLSLSAAFSACLTADAPGT